MHTRNKTQIRSPHPPQAVPLPRWGRFTMMPFLGVTVENWSENHGLIYPFGYHLMAVQPPAFSSGEGVLPQAVSLRRLTDEESTVSTNKRQSVLVR